MVMELFVEKLYRYDRKEEPMFIGVPVKEGELTSLEGLSVCDGGQLLPVQSRVTSRHKDGSIRFAFVRFMGDLPGNHDKKFTLNLSGTSGLHLTACPADVSCVTVTKEENGLSVVSKKTGGEEVLSFLVKNDTGSIFEELTAQGRTYHREQFIGPVLKDEADRSYDIRMNQWNIVEEGPVCVIVKNTGSNVCGDIHVDFEVKLTAWAGKPWVELSYRIINTTPGLFHVASLSMQILREQGSSVSDLPVRIENGHMHDSTGCGDAVGEADYGDGPVYHARNIGELNEIKDRADVAGVRTLVGSSNYKTDFFLGRGGASVGKYVDAEYLMKEANEHFGEVLYGTFMADCTDRKGGVCATIFQAQQNYPKAIAAHEGGLCVMLVPEGIEKVVMHMGMSRETKVLLHFHDADTSFDEIEDRSLIYQMPDRPFLDPSVHKESGVWVNVFADKVNVDVEQNLVARADAHCRAYGMLNFGDSYDGGYTAQGRGGGDLVWCNNEYDYPHACALMYVRTGIRRFLDYNIASCSHWMDVDVCHYHTDPLYIGGQWEHTDGHCNNGLMVCSHEWVEGLLDYYHLTGDVRGYETAIGIGENVLRLLTLPMYAKVGEANARETGWALRTLTALYVETGDEKWLVKCGSILNDFKVWEQQYGHWLAPYTDNTLVRVGFMISIAVGSVMRYYRVFPNEELKAMMLRAVDDLIESCYMEKLGCFYYKELPSLNRVGKNLLLLEALAIAYELSGDENYLKPGLRTFIKAIEESQAGAVGGKRIVKDAVVVGTTSSKNFAQSMIPLATYYRAVIACGLLEDDEC